MQSSDFLMFFIAEQSQYNSQQAGITTAIVLAVLIPVGCVLGCLLFKLREVAKERRREKGYDDNPSGGLGNNAVYKPTTQAANYGRDDDFKRGGYQEESDYNDDARGAYDENQPQSGSRYVDETFQRNYADSMTSQDTLRKEIRADSLTGLPSDPIGRGRSDSGSRQSSRKASRTNLVHEDPLLMRHEDPLLRAPNPMPNSPDNRSGALPPPPMDLMSPPRANTSSRGSSSPPGSRARANNFQDESTDNNTDNKYDAVYYTKEPLAQRPNLDFPDRTMDVDIDVHSYKPHGRPSAI